MMRPDLVPTSNNDYNHIYGLTDGRTFHHQSYIVPGSLRISARRQTNLDDNWPFFEGDSSRC